MRGTVARIVFALVGIVSILLGVSLQLFFTETTPPSQGLQLARDLLINCGVAVGTITIVDYIWSILGGEPLARQIARLASLNDLLADSSKTGITRVYSKIQHAPNPKWAQLISSSKLNIDLCGYQLLDLVDSQATLDALVAKADAGLRIRVLLYDPDHSSALDFAASQGNLNAMRANMKHALNRLNESQSSLPAKKRIQIKLVARNEVMDASVRRFDDLMYVVHYLHSVNTPDTPLFIVQREANPDCLFNTYLEWFESMFGRGIWPGIKNLTQP